MLTDLALFRRAHVGAARRAARAWRLVAELQSCSVLLPFEKTVQFVAHAIYFNAGYDASERYSCVDEFRCDLVDDVNKAYPERVSVDGVDCLVVRPFFSKETDFLPDLHLSYLHGCDPGELKALDVPAPELSTVEPTGLTASEVEALIAHHRGNCLKLVNRLRHLRTATHYLATGLANAAENKHRTHPEHVMDARAAGLVADLAKVADLPFPPSPCTHFSSDSNRINNLRTLPADEAVLEPLLTECLAASAAEHSCAPRTSGSRAQPTDDIRLGGWERPPETDSTTTPRASA